MALITRICSAIALLLASSAATAMPSALGSYARARLADAEGAGDQAVADYQAALIGLPDDGTVAFRAYREAVDNGNKKLAIRAAQVREAANAAPADAVLLLFSSALARGDWKASAEFLDRIEREGSFAFLVPSLRAWTDYASGSATPLAALDRRPWDGLSAVYVRENRVLLLLAMKRDGEALTILRSVLGTDKSAIALRLAAAAQLAAHKRKSDALSVLDGDDQAIFAARALINAGKPLPGAVTNAPAATAILFEHVARDLMRDGPSPAALTLARLASFAAPTKDSTRLVLAQALSLAGKSNAALAELSQIRDTSALAYNAKESRIAVLQRSGKFDAALVLATELAQSGSSRDLVRLGDVHARVAHYQEASVAYEAAIKRLTAEGVTAPWNLWLLYGGALDAAKDWPHAKPALLKAIELGPDQPDALNHLGFAMLERGDHVEEATRLIAKASALRPRDAAITDSLGWAWYKRGDMAQSINLLETAVEGDPTISEISEHLGDAYWTAGRRIDARYSWRAALVQADGADIETRLKGKIADGLPCAVK